MLRIKLKTHPPAGGSKLKANRTLGAGFTFIEMIVAISIFGIVALIASGFLLTTLSGSSKSEVSKEVRQNGNYALSIVEGLVLNSASIACPDTVNNRKLDIKDINGFTSNIICKDSPDYYISSSSGMTPLRLTGENVAVSNCSFVCEKISGKPSKVSIDFTVSQMGGSLRPNEKSSIRFQTEVMPRNF